MIFALVHRDLAAVDRVRVGERISSVEVARRVCGEREEWNGDLVCALQRDAVVDSRERVKWEKGFTQCDERAVENDIQFEFGADGGGHDVFLGWVGWIRVFVNYCGVKFLDAISSALRLARKMRVFSAPVAFFHWS